MYTPQELERMPIELEKLFQQLEIDIMLDIIRRMKINNNEITRAADWQIYRLQRIGKSKRAIKKYLQEALELSRREINKIYRNAIKSGYAEDERLYRWLGKKQISYEDNEELQQLISAISEQTNEKLYNITQSTGFIKNINGQNVFTPLTEYYQQTLDNSVNGVLNGAFDYNTVIKKTVQEMTKSGLRTVDYASGRSYRIDSAVRTALMTGVNQVASKISDKNAKELDTEYFEVSAHGTARPSHQAWQGRVYSKKELEEVCGLGKVDGLCGANCRHSYYPFIPGISERTYTDEELEQWAKEENTPRKYGDKEYTAYEASQEQRRLERMMRKQRQDIKLLKEAEANNEDITVAQAKYRITSDEYVKFSKAMNLPEQRARVYQDGIKINRKLKANDLNYSNTKSVIVNKRRINYNDKKEVKKAINDFVNQHTNSDIEYARVISKDNWEFDIKGNKNTVDLTIVDNLKDSIVIHNHPREETEYSFSKQDINVFIEKELNELYGIDDKYIYKLIRNGKDIDSNENLEQIFENVQHFNTIQLAKKFGIGYRRYRNNGEGI